MIAVFKSLFAVLVAASHAELARQVQYLKVENRMLRGKLPKRIVLTPAERARLVRFGAPLGDAIKELISIVTPKTFKRWLKREAGLATMHLPRRRPGRPRKPEEIRDLIVRIAKETGWGYSRILGELRKLGIDDVSRATVRTILKEHGIEPAPERGGQTWDEFLKAHAETLWACDFFTKPVLTWRGFRTAYVLFFLHLQTRRVILCPSTVSPTRMWTAHQADRFLRRASREGFEPPAILLRDGDGKFGGRFNRVLRDAGCRAKRLPVRSPKLNAFAERWIRSVKAECLNHFFVVGLGHLDHLLAVYLAHYLNERPHQGLHNRLIRATGPPPDPAQPVVCRSRLGGILHHYERQAA